MLLHLQCKKKKSFIIVNIPIQEERKESLKCCLFGGKKVVDSYYNSYRIPTRINKYKFLPEWYSLSSLFFLLSAPQPPA